MPDLGHIGGNFPISLAEEAIESWASQIARVSYPDFSVIGERLGEVTGSRVMAIAEASGEDENARSSHLQK